MTNDTKLSDLTVSEFKVLMRECLQQDMDAAKEVERMRAAFFRNRWQWHDDLNSKLSATGRMVKLNTPESLTASSAHPQETEPGRDE